MSVYLVTGAAGFIGSAVCRLLAGEMGQQVIAYDKLTYAANTASLAPIADVAGFELVIGDVCDAEKLRETIRRVEPDIVLHLAAESHVDRSIDGPAEFITTNIVGTFTVLEAIRDLVAETSRNIRYHHVSTDEVYGSLPLDSGVFTEETAYAPSSPYAASKAGSDHLAMAWHHTFGLDVVLSNCSNNYGPCQFPEKLIPLMILNAHDEKPLPVYGSGQNVRDWLHVDDHARALAAIATGGLAGRSYNVGGNEERSNLAVVETICQCMDELHPRKGAKPHLDLVTYVADRPGHDLRYAIDAGRISDELDWRPQYDFETGIRDTVQWYLNNRQWWEPIRQGRYHGDRLGLASEPAPSTAPDRQAV